MNYRLFYDVCHNCAEPTVLSVLEGHRLTEDDTFKCSKCGCRWKVLHFRAMRADTQPLTASECVRRTNERLQELSDEGLLKHIRHMEAKLNPPRMDDARPAHGASRPLFRWRSSLLDGLGTVAKPKSDGAVSDGSSADYYKLPAGAKQLQDLISHRDMNSQMGEIFRAVYRYGQVSHSSKLRDAKKIKFYIEAEIARLEKYAG